MKTVIAIDSFKGSISSLRAGEATAKGIKRVFPDAECRIFPIADGGEGTVEAIVGSLNGKIVSLSVTGPLGEKTVASYGVTPDGSAVIEMAQAAGLTLVSEEKRDPLYTTTYGVGELIAHAIKHSGCRKFIIGIGGSATNDGGAGMLSALGFEFLSGQGTPVSPGAAGLKDLAYISAKDALPELCECSFSVACDVKNPLCGEMGCSAVYGPQKGADAEAVRLMDGYLSKYADISAELFGTDNRDVPGAGAAGGMGFAFISYLGARLVPGIELVTESIGIEKEVRECDLVITGEGRLDRQTAMGKAPIGIAAIAKKHGKLTIAFSGCVANGAELCNEGGIDAFFPILRTPCSLEEAMDGNTAEKNLTDTAEQVARLLRASKLGGKNEPFI